MADRYCILPNGGAGSWTNIAIWRDVGGNSVSSYPSTNADTAVFTTSVSITNVPAPFPCGLIVENQATVALTTNASPAGYAIYKRWTIDGTLRMALGQQIYHNGGLFMADNSHLVVNHATGNPLFCMRTVEDMRFGDGCSVAVPGGRIWINATDGAENIIPKANYLDEVFLFNDPTFTEKGATLFFGPGSYVFSLLRISGRCIRTQGIGGPITVHGGQATLKVGELAFYRSNLGHATIFQPEDAEIEITGDVVTDVVNTGPLTIGTGSKPWKLAGTQDQVIRIPRESRGSLNHTLAKPAGNVSLYDFDGELSGTADSLVQDGGNRLALVGPGTFGKLEINHSSSGVFRFERGNDPLTVRDLVLSARGGSIEVCHGTTATTSVRNLILTRWNSHLIPFNTPNAADAENYPLLVWTIEGEGDAEQVVSGFDRGNCLPVFRILKGQDPAGDPVVEKWYEWEERSGARSYGTGSVRLIGVVGYLSACCVGRLAVDPDSELRLCFDDSYYPSSPTDYAHSFCGYAGELVNRGRLLFYARERYSPDGGTTLLGKTRPELFAGRLSNEGEILGFDASNVPYSGWPIPPDFGRVHVPWNEETDGNEAGSAGGNGEEWVFPGMISPQVSVHRCGVVFPPELSEAVLDGPVSGMMPVQLVFQAKYCVQVVVSWGDGFSETVSSDPTGTVEHRLWHTYPANAGQYVILLTGSNDNGTEVTLEIRHVRIGEPVPVLAVNPSEGTVPLETVAHPEGSQADEYQIDWGDGSLSELLDIASPCTHVYEESGDFQVVLSVRYRGGAFVSTAQLVHVDPGESVDAKAVLNVEPNSGYAPLMVSARATGSIGTSFKFDWGDGTNTGFQTQRTATHTYERAGLYPITLTAKQNKTTASTFTGVVVHYESGPPRPTVAPIWIERASAPSRLGLERVADSPYRLTLAQGTHFMTDSIELFCEMSENGRALAGGSALFLARILHAGGEPLLPTEVRSLRYTLWKLDDRDASVRVAIPGHTEVPLDAATVLLESLTLDEHWSHDAIGYNFRHAPLPSRHDDGNAESGENEGNGNDGVPLFPEPGRNYRLEYRFVLRENVPDVLLAYRVHVV